MASAIKAAVRDCNAAGMAFGAQKTMYGGKAIAAGDTLFIFASENESGRGLIARGLVLSAEAIPAHRAGQAAARQGRAEAAPQDDIVAYVIVEDAEVLEKVEDLRLLLGAVIWLRENGIQLCAGVERGSSRRPQRGMRLWFVDPFAAVESSGARKEVLDVKRSKPHGLLQRCRASAL